ncbi:hypothetical protein [Candidatus Frankia alpina]|uniref:hypothetical protein n=1 Tax=Candidatus Frankia alpina TaxID=2699483 RepID=UPI0013D3170B|nr:hypothetical protein [Candidatus Frankia alpina]
MAITVARILSRRPSVPRRAPTPVGAPGLRAGAVGGRPVTCTRPLAAAAEPEPAGAMPVGASEARTRPLPRTDAGADVLPRRAGGLPHELVFRVTSASRHNAIPQLQVETDEQAVLADWALRGRVELMAARRPFVLEMDLDGRGVRLVEPMGRVPVAAFVADRVGGRVRLADGCELRWLTPTRGEFASGLVGHHEVNIIRFALDGTALVMADPDLLDPAVARVARMVRASDAGPGDTCRGDIPDPRLGWLPDVVALLVLAWFLRLLECTAGEPARSSVRDLGV